MKLILAITAVLPLALLAFSAMEPANAATPAATYEDDQDYYDGDEGGCIYRESSNPCTSCHETGVLDVECNDGTDFRECQIKAPTICTNGARCDQEAGKNPCP